MLDAIEVKAGELGASRGAHSIAQRSITSFAGDYGA